MEYRAELPDPTHMDEVLDNVPEKVLTLLNHPESYTGRAAEKALETTARARQVIDQHSR